MAFQTFAPRSVCGVSEKNSATTPPPPPNPATGKFILLPPPPTCGCFLGITENVCYYPPPSHPHRIRLASGDHGQFLLLPPPHRTWSAAGAHGNVAPPPNKNPGYAGAPSTYRGSGNQMKIFPSYIVHALVTSLYTTYIFRGFVKKSIATITRIDPRRTNLNFVGLGPLPVPQNLLVLVCHSPLKTCILT